MMLRQRQFVHLHVHSPFSFLDGASEVQDIVARAAELGMPAMALTDHDNVCAAVEFSQAATALGVKPIQGVEATLKDGGHLTLLARGPRGYAALCRALTRAHLDSKRLMPQLALEDIPAGAKGEIVALTGCRHGRIARSLLKGDFAAALAFARSLEEVFGADSLFAELEGARLPGGGQLNAGLVELARVLGLGCVVTNNVHYAGCERFPVHDLLTCVRTLSRLDMVHPARRLNAENYLKSGEEMAAALWSLPAAVVDRTLETTLDLAAGCQPALEFGRRRHPRFGLPDGEPASDMLRRLTYQGAQQRYGGVSAAVTARLEHELDVISKLGYEEYFLLVWDVVAYARRQGIRCAGRGSAADSAVAYCLHITDVDSIRRGLLFERFMNLERAEMPDIDVDFDARYRDDVTAYVYRRYGRDHVATVATYNTFHARSAVRDLGKAMGFAPAELDALAKRLPWMSATRLEAAFREVPELRDSGIDPHKFRRLAAACTSVAGFPRHLGTHLGGVVISRDPLTDVTPLQMAAKGVTVTQFDKIGVEDLGLVKLDLLSLRTLGAVEDTLASINRGRSAAAARTPDAGRRGAGDEAAKGRGGGGHGACGDAVDDDGRSDGAAADLRYDTIPAEDRSTYAMLGRGETIGSFQLESPAQRALQARFGADCFEDIVASVALIRPGPIKGNMVEPYIARRKGYEEVTYLHPALRPILEKTYGVVLFQEQVIEIAIAVAGFTAGEADRLRRVMTHGRSREDMADIGRCFVAKSVSRGIEPGVAETIFQYVAGYASYGFCEAHAAAFADIAYKTAYLLNHHPAHFFAAILNHQPMGYYPAHVLCVEARRRGVEVLAPDVNRSEADFTVETLTAAARGASGDRLAVRVGLKRVKSLSAAGLGAVTGRRGASPYRDLGDFLRRTVPQGLDAAGVDSLILAGACDCLAQPSNRRRLLWQAAGLVEAARAGELPLYRDVRAQDGREEMDAGGIPGQGASQADAVPDFGPWDLLLRQYEALGFTTGPHPMSFYRRQLTALGYLDSLKLARRRLERGASVRVAGVLVRPHRPPTRSGRTIVFLSLEDEVGLTDVTVFEDVYQRHGKLIFGDVVPPLAVHGRLDRRGRGVSVRAESVYPLTDVLAAASKGAARGRDEGSRNEISKGGQPRR
jgi:error-prone DNA polymerase